MLLYIRSLYPNQIIKVPIETRSPQRMVISVYHDDGKPHTVYFQSHPLVNGKVCYDIKIPKSPRGLIMEVYNEANGNIPNDPTFRVGKISIDKLIQTLTISGIMDNNTASFARFSDWFAENAGCIPARNKVYTSLDGKFVIDYKDVIRDKDGNELATPARINGNTGIIEISKKYYLGFTVPGRKAINWHEFSHVYKNQNPANEFEADKNAILIYLSMGNPKLEARLVFLKTFENTPSDLNKKRYQELDYYINNFENISQNQGMIAA